MRSIVILIVMNLFIFNSVGICEESEFQKMQNYNQFLREVNARIKFLQKKDSKDPRIKKLEDIKVRTNTLSGGITEGHLKKLKGEIEDKSKPTAGDKKQSAKDAGDSKGSTASTKKAPNSDRVAVQNGVNNTTIRELLASDSKAKTGETISASSAESSGTTGSEIKATPVVGDSSSIASSNSDSGSSKNSGDLEKLANQFKSTCAKKDMSSPATKDKDASPRLISKDEMYTCTCLANPEVENTSVCKRLAKQAGIEDVDDKNSCSGLLKSYEKSLEDKEEACGKGPSSQSCIQDYMDCTSGVLKNKDVYDNVNDKLTDAMKLQALFKSAGTQAGIPGKTLDKCNMLSGRDFFAKKDKLEEKKKDLERDLQEAKKGILENQKNNAIEAQELKDQIANLKTEFEEKKKSMSEEMRNMTKSMIDRSKDLESKKKETALTIQKKNIEIMNMLNVYNKQLAMVTMNGSSAANCKMEMMKQKEILDKQKLGGNVGNSIQKKNLLTTSFKTCMENLKKDLKLMQETFQKQKEIADTELINLNSEMSSYSEEIESSKRELEQFKKDHANELTTAEKSMMEKLMALAQRQQEQMQRTTQQNINDQELIKNYEAELRATTLEIMAMGNEEPSNREGDKNWPAVEDKIASARNKANDYYQACCLPDKEDAGKNSCKRLNDGDGSYKAVGKEGAKKVIPTNSTGSGKAGIK